MSECTTKHCAQCNLIKDINDFGRSYSYRRKICSACRSLNRRESYKINKEKILSQNKKWRDNNLEKKKAYDKNYYIRNRLKILNRCKSAEYKLKIIPVKRRWAFLNREKIKNYPSYNKRKKKPPGFFKNKLKTNSSFRLRVSISNSIRKSLKKKNISKCKKSFIKYLPYSIQDLKFHLENLFEPWMHWGNWGVYKSKIWDDNDSSTWTWQIDHIIPQSMLPFHSMEEENFIKCWSLENLRPLSAKQNCLKSNKY